VVAVLAFTSAASYYLLTTDDWDREEIAHFDGRSPSLVSITDAEGNAHLLFVGRADGSGVHGLIYGMSVGQEMEFELVATGWDKYESLSIAVDSRGAVYAGAVVRDDE
jgi:hypothetical protein